MKVMLFLLAFLMSQCRGKRPLDNPIDTEKRNRGVSQAEEPWYRNKAQRIAAAVQQKGYKLSEAIQSGDNQGYWAAGHVIGTVSRTARRGVFFKSNEIDFVLAPTKVSSSDYPGQRLKMSVLSDDVFAQIQKLKPETPVVLQFVRVYKKRPVFTTETPFYVIQVKKPTTSFKSTNSFKKHGYSYIEPQKVSKKRKGSYAESDSTGYIVSVMRWGFDTFGKTCSISLHEGGQKMVRQGVGTRSSRMNVVNISTMNTYDEDGCRYSEDVLGSSCRINAKTTQQFYEWWNVFSKSIHEMKTEGC